MKRLLQGLSSFIAASSLAVLLLVVASEVTASTAIDTELGRKCGRIESQVVVPGQPPELGCRSEPDEKCLNSKNSCVFKDDTPTVGEDCECKRNPATPIDLEP